MFHLQLKPSEGNQTYQNLPLPATSLFIAHRRLKFVRPFLLDRETFSPATKLDRFLAIQNYIPSFEFQLLLFFFDCTFAERKRGRERERGGTSSRANIQTRLLKNNQSQARFASILNFSPVILKIVRGHTSKVVSEPRAYRVFHSRKSHTRRKCISMAERMVVNLGSPQGWHRGANYRSTVKLPVDFSNLCGVKGMRGVVVAILLRLHVHRFVQGSRDKLVEL